MSNGDSTAPRKGARTRAYGQNYQPSVLNRLGVWLSARQIRRYTGLLKGKHLGDFECSYHATFARSVLRELKQALLVDFRLSEDLKSLPNVMAIEGILPDVLCQIPSASADIVLCISVLERLRQPLTALQDCLRIVRPGGTYIFNVPSWRGKRFLEYSAFRLGLSPRDEMDDHKTYYDVKDFWPLLVRTGFRPSNVRYFSRKFGLDTFAVCQTPPCNPDTA
jgi:SAM-dependent methyltransferase